MTTLQSELISLNLKTNQTQTQYLPNRCFSSSLFQNKLLIATACRSVISVNLAVSAGILTMKQEKPVESPLRHQSR